MKILFQALSNENYLYKLGLVDIGINDESMKQLCKNLQTNNHLLDLDISCSKAKPSSFL